MYARSPLESIRLFHDELTALRRDLHAHPELGFEEVRTSGIVAGALEALGIEVHRGIGKTGVVGVIRGKRCDSGRMIGLRADMDALPMTEDNTFGHKSTKPGLMHGCGHDGHTAVLVGAAKYLAQTRNFDGTAVLIFQPAEEGRGGARAMLEDGLFDTFPCDAIYALHNWPGLKPGTIGINPGPMMAAADRFEILITGRGGHGAHPYQTIDPVTIAGQIITALQTIVSRNVNPLDSAVLSIGSVQAGHPGAMSVIPREARMVGTVRTFRKSVQEMVETRMRELVSAIAGAFGGTAEVVYERIYPATLNTPQHANLVADIATEMIGKENVVRDLVPSMGSEDFSFMLQAKPGAYFRLGQGGADSGCLLHNPHFDFNDAVIPLGSAMFCALAERGMPLAD
ncbi:amidohydrolase [Achromobacter mucicolens]|uniref:M20 aminoacylase family protein n=1 Tax=Achromobacter mucicolens TaxID=1389922 RepID=UPI0007C709B2|nr:M20 aminoacylase family protein [Achromobacter mucicolens]OAE56242.1 peptidase M20 [Achromobacter xylosoxidans]PTX00053.1 amidohydrolase [Achromobacter mucicolens]